MARRTQRTADKSSSNFSREKARWRKLRAIARIEQALDMEYDPELEQQADALAARICPDSVVRSYIRENRRGGRANG